MYGSGNYEFSNFVKEDSLLWRYESENRKWILAYIFKFLCKNCNLACIYVCSSSSGIFYLLFIFYKQENLPQAHT